MIYHKYGIVQFDGVRVGDLVRFVSSPKIGQPGLILKPRNGTEANAVLRRVHGSQGYVELVPQTNLNLSAHSEAGAASGISVPLRVSAGGVLKIS